MGYTATVLRVMIASPSDVSDERHIIHEVVEEWNVVQAEDRKIVLMPLAWQTHSSPEMGDRPQAIINRQVLRDADLLVAVFWTRLGSPSGTAPSGTVEEIEEHLAAGKPAMIYFSSAAVQLDRVDSAQYSALQAFKEQCRQKGLIEQYDTLAEFKAKLSRQLAQTVIRHFTPVPANVADVQPPPQPVPAISSAAQNLLMEASRSSDGVIMRIETFGGTQVKTNNRNFVEANDARSAARWRGVVDELYREGLIEDKAGKGQVFFVTGEGYRVADLLRGKSSA